MKFLGIIFFIFLVLISNLNIIAKESQLPKNDINKYLKYQKRITLPEEYADERFNFFIENSCIVTNKYAYILKGEDSSTTIKKLNLVRINLENENIENFDILKIKKLEKQHPHDSYDRFAVNDYYLIIRIGKQVFVFNWLNGNKIEYDTTYTVKSSPDNIEIKGNICYLIEYKIHYDQPTKPSLKTRKFINVTPIDLQNKEIKKTYYFPNTKGLIFSYYIPPYYVDMGENYFIISEITDYKIYIYENKNFKLVDSIVYYSKEWKSIDSITLTNYNDLVEKLHAKNIIDSIRTTYDSIFTLNIVTMVNDSTILVKIRKPITIDTIQNSILKKEHYHYDLWQKRAGIWSLIDSNIIIRSFDSTYIYTINEGLPFDYFHYKHYNDIYVDLNNRYPIELRNGMTYKEIQDSLDTFYKNNPYNVKVPISLYIYKFNLME